MKRIAFDAAAVGDISAIREFISRDSKQAANHVVKGIMSAIATLGVFPRSGRRGRVNGTHELVIKGLPYIVVYVIAPDIVEIDATVQTASQKPRRTIR